MTNLIKFGLWAVVFVLLFRMNKALFALVTALFALYGLYLYIPMFWAGKARDCFDKGEFSKAIEFYKKATKRDKVNFNIKLSYAYTLMRAGKFDDAETFLNAIVRDRRNTKPEQRNMAKQQRCMVYLRQGRYSEAMEEAMEMFNGGYKNTQMYAMLGYFKLLGNEPQSEITKFCEEAYDYNSEGRDIMDNLAICYYNEGRYSEAKEISDKLIAEAPEFMEAYYHGAQIALKCNDKERAKELAQKIDGCRRTAMTTITREEVEDIKTKAGLK